VSERQREREEESKQQGRQPEKRGTPCCFQCAPHAVWWDVQRRTAAFGRTFCSHLGRTCVRHRAVL